MLKITQTKNNKTNQRFFALKIKDDENFNEILDAIKDLEERKFLSKYKVWVIPAKKEYFYEIAEEIMPLAEDTKISKAGYKLIDWVEKDKNPKINFIVKDIKTEIVSEHPIPMELKDELAYRPDGYFWNDAYKKGNWDGYVRLIKNRKFPTGLLNKAIKCIEELEDWEFEVIDKREESEKKFDWEWFGFEPYPYQKETIDNIKEKKRGIVEIATGGGKTSVIASKATQELGRYTVFLVHTKILLYQAQEEFENNLDIEVGIVGDGNFNIKPVTVAMIQTLKKNLDSPKVKAWANKAEVIFADECQHISADTYQEVMSKFNTEYKIGLSASPWRDDGKDILIEAEAGNKIAQVKAIDLIEEGYLADVSFNYVKINPLNCGLREGASNYQSAYKKFITNNDERNDLIIKMADYLAYNGKSVLILVSRIGHGKFLRNEMNKMGMSVKFLQGKHTSKQRKKAMRKMKKDKLDILIATTIADEGMDLPVLDSLILAGAGKSSTKALQRVGRTLRKDYEGKKSVVFDFYDDFKYFKKHSKERLKIYKHEFGKERINMIPYKKALDKLRITP